MASLKDAFWTQMIQDFKYVTTKSYEVTAAAKAQTQEQKDKDTKERFSGT
ncbi:hypothetical protein ACP4OV_015058 [Aristida adscensionis]